MMECNDYCLHLLEIVQEKNINKFKLICEEYSKKHPIIWRNIYHRKSGDTVLHIATRIGCVEILRYLKDDADFEQSNFDGKRPIHEAAQYGQLECLQFLLKIGVKIDCLKRADWTPLMLACTKNNLEIIQYLIEAGADPKLRNKDGWNSFHIACSSSIRTLAFCEDEKKTLFKEGHFEIINYLLKVESSLWNNKSNNGRTPLHTAALHGKLDVVEILMNKGSFNVDEQDNCGSTPLMDASRSGHINIMELLINMHQADIYKNDILGRNSLHLAAQANSLEAINYLITTCKMDPNSLSMNHETALHLAAKENQDDSVDLLLRYGVNCNIQDNRRRTAYDIAKSLGHKKCQNLMENQ